MTIEQFGQTIKQKYPQYNNLSDDQVGSLVLQKYPQYQNMVDQNQIQQPQKSVFGQVAGAINQGYEAYSNVAKKTGIPQAVGFLTQKLGNTVGGLVGSAAEATRQGIRASQGKGFDIGQINRTRQRVSGTTGEFGQQGGEAGTIAAPLGAAGKLVNLAVAYGQGYEGFQNVKQGIQENDPEKALLGGLNLGVAALGAKGAIKTKGLIVNKDVIAPIAKRVSEVTGIGGKPTEAKVNQIISKRANEIYNIENNYANTRKRLSFSKDENASSRQRVASTDVLINSVDENGLIRTKQKGGAVEQYKALTLDKAEGLVRNDLAREGSFISPQELKSQMTRKVLSSGLEGKALVTALKNVDLEIEGLMLRARPDGNIPLEVLHDAKISTTNGINYMTEPLVKAERKAVASAYKSAIEEKSNLPIREVNTELSKYLKDVELLESLDGKRVKGGRLGKYFSQFTGNIVGAATGALVGGPVGAGIGSVLGGELSSKVQGRNMQGTFGKSVGNIVEKSPTLESAINRSKSPRLMLSAPKEGAPRSSMPSGKPIPLYKETQSSADRKSLKKSVKSFNKNKLFVKK